MNFLSNLREFAQKNWLSMLAVVVIVAIGVGYVLFFLFSIEPGLRTRSRLTTQLADARKILADTRKDQADSPDNLRARLANARATLNASLNVFLTDSQASEIVSALYQYASASGVVITDVQMQPPIAQPSPTPQPSPTRPAPTPTVATQPAATPPAATPTLPAQASPTRPTPTQTLPPQPVSSQGQNGIYSVTTIRLQAQGDSRKLVDFVSRIREASTKAFVVNSINITGGEGGNATLTMDISLFVSPYSSATPMPFPTLKPTATATPLPTATPSPTPKMIKYMVRAGDTLFSLARRYSTTVNAIMVANGLPNYNIRVGQQLLIPAGDP